MDFADKYRPTTPEQLIGEIQRENVAKPILKDIRAGNKVQPILLVGPSGSGKTTIAQMIAAEYVGEENLDNPMIVERVNSSSETSINFIRDNFKPTMNMPSMYSKYKVWFFDEVHGWTPQAQNALLDDIEFIPDHIIVVATTTEPDKIIPALRSRFDEHKLTQPSVSEQIRLVRAIAKREGLELDEKLERDLVDSAAGNIRKLVKNIGKAVQGSFVYVKEIEEESQFFQELFFKNSSLATLFKVASDEVTDYNGMAVRMAHAAITMIQKNNKNAQYVLEVFGEGLSTNTSPKASFFNKLQIIHRMKND